MKLTYSLIISLLFITLEVFGQSAPQKYVLMEHFTNSRCSTCASRNPAFYDVIHAPENEGKIHHITIHPPYPYEQCAFYQHNTNDNLVRTEFYGVLGTPRVFVWGTQNSEGIKLLSQERLNTFLNQTAPIAILVEESTDGNSRTANIEVKSYENIAGDNLKLFAAVVEKVVNYNAPNGEKEHFDVLRKTLPTYDGIAFNPAAMGESKNFSFTYDLNAEWDASQIYVVAFVQNVATKEVLNSGTRFDEVATGIEESVLDKNIRLYPNPTNDFIHLQLNDNQLNIQEVALYNNSGALLQSFEGNPSKIDVRSYPSGIYFVKLKSGEEMIYRKVVVQ
ncbi:MAG: T9SS type A sorting domain-containing protein [Chitinophagales bacterium]